MDLNLTTISPELPVYSRLPITIARGQGCCVWDDQGRKYLDLYGGHAVACLGYGNPRLSGAIADAAQQLLFQTNAVHLEAREQACRQIISVAPAGLAHVFLCNSGAEANENALRLAFLHSNRSKVVALKGAFHGRTAAAGAITDRSSTWYGFPRTPFDVEWVNPEDFEALAAAIDDRCAAFIFEPIQGVAGAVTISDEFVRYAKELCQARGALMIADEVQTGIGRSGTMFAIDQTGISPDILTTAKGLAGGFPCAAVITSEAVAAKVGIGTLGTTFGGGPVASAAISATLSIVSEPEFLADLSRRSALLIKGCQDAGVQTVSGKGFLLGLHCSQPAAAIRGQLLAAGFLTGDAKNPNVVRLLPPLIISDSEISEFVTALGQILS